jgi:Uma2 family endonuclease
MPVSVQKLTYSDLLALPADGKRHELIDGEHFVSPSPSLRHQIVLSNLFRALDGRIHTQDLGRLLFAPVDIVLSPHDVVEPDLLFISHERAAILSENFLTGAPDLVVEVLSPSTRRLDMSRKRRLYQRFGVAEYWIVDPVAEAVAVYRGTEGLWLRPAAHFDRRRGDERLVTPLLGGLAIPLAEIFA